jgi:integrase
MSVKKRGKYYHFRFMLEGELYYGPTGETAKTPAEDYEHAYKKGIRNGTIKPGMEMPTLEEFSSRFLTYIDKNQKLKPKTKDFYRGGWRLLQRTAVAAMKLDRIKRSTCDTLSFPGGPGYANQGLRTLSRILNFAVEEEIIAAPPKVPMRAEQGRERLIAPWEESLLLECATPALRDILIIMLDNGLRPNEVVRLRWEDIGWEQTSILIRSGKTLAASRYVPLTERMRVMLEARRRRNDRADRKANRMDSPWVFPAPTSPSGHMGSNQSRAWGLVMDRVAEKLRAQGEPMLAPGLVLYSARHTFATQFLRNGGDVGQLTRLMGHTNMKTTLRYLHMIDAGQSAAVMNRHNESKKLILLRKEA